MHWRLILKYCLATLAVLSYIASFILLCWQLHLLQTGPPSSAQFSSDGELFVCKFGAPVIDVAASAACANRSMLVSPQLQRYWNEHAFFYVRSAYTPFPPMTANYNGTDATTVPAAGCRALPSRFFVSAAMALGLIYDVIGIALAFTKCFSLPKHLRIAKSVFGWAIGGLEVIYALVSVMDSNQLGSRSFAVIPAPPGLDAVYVFYLIVITNLVGMAIALVGIVASFKSGEGGGAILIIAVGLIVPAIIANAMGQLLVIWSVFYKLFDNWLNILLLVAAETLEVTEVVDLILALVDLGSGAKDPDSWV